jgi:hypothetical protein
MQANITAGRTIERAFSGIDDLLRSGQDRNDRAWPLFKSVCAKSRLNAAQMGRLRQIVPENLRFAIYRSSGDQAGSDADAA